MFDFGFMPGSYSSIPGAGFAGTLFPAMNPTAVMPNNPAAVAPTASAADVPWWQTVIGGASNVFSSVLAYKTANNQIAHGQIPSTVGTNGQFAGTANVTPFSANVSGMSTWIIIGAVVLIFVMLLRK